MLKTLAHNGAKKVLKRIDAKKIIPPNCLLTSIHFLAHTDFLAPTNAKK